MIKKVLTSNGNGGYNYSPSDLIRSVGSSQEYFFVEGDAFLEDEVARKHDIASIKCQFEVVYTEDHQIAVVIYFDRRTLPAVDFSTKKRTEDNMGRVLHPFYLRFSEFSGMSQPHGLFVKVSSTKPIIPQGHPLMLDQVYSLCDRLEVSSPEGYAAVNGVVFNLVGPKKLDSGYVAFRIRNRAIRLIRGSYAPKMLIPQESSIYLQIDTEPNEEQGIEEIANAMCLVFSLTCAYDINWTWYEKAKGFQNVAIARSIRLHTQPLISSHFLQRLSLFANLTPDETLQHVKEGPLKKVAEQPNLNKKRLTKLAENYLDLPEQLRDDCQRVWREYISYSQLDMLPSLEGNLRLVTSLAEELLYSWEMTLRRVKGAESKRGMKLPKRLRVFFNQTRGIQPKKNIGAFVLTRNSIMHYGRIALENSELVAGEEDSTGEKTTFSQAMQSVLQMKQPDAGLEIQNALGFLPLMMYALLKYGDFKSLLTRYPFVPD